jgi:hypothetical protein
MPRKPISEQVTNRRSVLDQYPLSIDISNKKKMDTRKKPTDGDKIINFYEVIPKKYLLEAENPNYDVHNIDLPFRMCVVAPSGSGKTNFLVNLIKVFSQGKGTFADIHICTANKDEPLYNWLTKENEQITISEGISSTPKLDSMDKEENHLVIWDDLVLTKDLSSVEKYYIRARKLNCSVVFLSQSYYDIPKMIRKNSSYLVILNLGGSKRETTAILNEWGTELDKDELKAIYEDCTSEHMRPLIIAGGKQDRNKKYRKGWKDYYNLDKFLKNIPRTLPKKRMSKTDYSSESDSD